MLFAPAGSTRRRLRGRVVTAGLSVLCFGTATLVSPVSPVGSAPPAPPPGARLSERAIAAFPAAVRRLMADVSWIRAVQHYGNRRLAGSPDFPELSFLVENTLRLDPGFRPAAVAGALLVAEPRPLGPGEPQRAERLLHDWTDRHPHDFEALLVRALLVHWHLDDPGRAARILEAASARGDAPGWFAALAARSLAEGGAREAARTLWLALAARAGDARMRANARTHLLQLDALDERDRLVGVVEEFERGRGRRPHGWEELIGAGFLPEAPADPAGVPFELDGDGLPRIARNSPLAGYPGR